jgi:acetylcholinesterase
MLSNGGDTEGLFHSCFMHSMILFPDDSDVSIGQFLSTSYYARRGANGEQGQPVFDEFATAAGCGDLLGSQEVFKCLRALPIATILNATNPTPSVYGYSVRGSLDSGSNTR